MKTLHSRMKELLRERYIPPDVFETIEHPQGGDRAIVYVYGTHEKPCGISYVGKAGRSTWNYQFRGADGLERARAHAQELFKSVDDAAATKERRRQERAKPHILKVGQVIYNSWGYDQTNVDFYRVVKASAKYVWLRPLQQHVNETGFMAGQAVALTDFGSDEITQHRATADGYVNFRFGAGTVWDGDPVYTSWYA